MSLSIEDRGLAEELLAKLHAVVADCANPEMVLAVSRLFADQVMESKLDHNPELVAGLMVDVISYYSQVLGPRVAEAGSRMNVQPPPVPGMGPPKEPLAGTPDNVEHGRRMAGDEQRDPLHDPGRGPGFQVSNVWIYVALDESGGEGVMAISGRAEGRSLFIPTIATDERRRDFLREPALKMGRMSRKVVKLLRFGTREEMEVVYDPNKGRG
jgi:hypothetical protein